MLIPRSVQNRQQVLYYSFYLLFFAGISLKSNSTCLPEAHSIQRIPRTWFCPAVQDPRAAICGQLILEDSPGSKTETSSDILGDFFMTLYVILNHKGFLFFKTKTETQLALLCGMSSGAPSNPTPFVHVLKRTQTSFLRRYWLHCQYSRLPDPHSVICKRKPSHCPSHRWLSRIRNVLQPETEHISTASSHQRL